jgi:hypothetical protein
MDSVGLVVLGAVIGAAATGGIQAWTGARQRRRERKVAARAILGDLFLTEGFLRGVLNYGQWPVAFDGDRPLVTWKEFRGPFAAAVSGAEWAQVDRVFGLLHQITLAVSVGDASVEPARPLIADLLIKLEAAQNIVARHAADSEDQQRQIEDVLRPD